MLKNNNIFTHFSIHSPALRFWLILEISHEILSMHSSLETTRSKAPVAIFLASE